MVFPSGGQRRARLDGRQVRSRPLEIHVELRQVVGPVEELNFGGLVLGVAEALAVGFIPGQFGGSAWKDVWAFVLLIIVLVFRPQGLLGARVVDRA